MWCMWFKCILKMPCIACHRILTHYFINYQRVKDQIYSMQILVFAIFASIFRVGFGSINQRNSRHYRALRISFKYKSFKLHINFVVMFKSGSWSYWVFCHTLCLKVYPQRDYHQRSILPKDTHERAMMFF